MENEMMKELNDEEMEHVDGGLDRALTLMIKMDAGLMIQGYKNITLEQLTEHIMKSVRTTRPNVSEAEIAEIKELVKFCYENYPNYR